MVIKVLLCNISHIFLLVSSNNEPKLLFNKANTQTTKTLFNNIKIDSFSCEGVRKTALSLTELLFELLHSNELYFRAVLNQKMYQKMSSL